MIRGPGCAAGESGPSGVGAARKGYWYRAANPSQLDIAYRNRCSDRFEFDVAIGRRLQRGDQRLPRSVSRQPSVIIGRYHDNLVTTVDGYVLGAFTPHLFHQLAEAGLRVLQCPGSGSLPIARPVPLRGVGYRYFADS